MKEAVGVLIGIVVLFLCWFFFDKYLMAQHIEALQKCFGNTKCRNLTEIALKAQPAQCFIRAPGFSSSYERRLYVAYDQLRFDLVDVTGKTEDLHAITRDGKQYVWQGKNTVYRGEIPSFDEVSQEPTICTKLVATESLFSIPAEVIDPTAVMPNRNR